MSRTEVHLNDIGEGLAEAVISQWLVKPGDLIKEMQPYVEIDTDKVTTELPSPVAGRVLELCFAEGDSVDIGACLLYIDTSDEPTTVSPAAPTQPVAVQASPAQGQTGGAPARAQASPAVRTYAAERGIDLNLVVGTGPGGTITSADVRLYADAAEPAVGAGDRTEPLSAIRNAIAEHMYTAWREVPHITDLREVAVPRLEHRKNELRDHPSRPTYTAFFVSAVAQALRAYPRLNASLDWERREVTLHDQIDIGVATYIDDDRLVVPVVRNADRLDIFQISDELRRLGELAKSRKLTREDMSGATFNISSAGQMGGGWYGTPIVSPPQVGVMGFGPILERVVAENSVPVVRPAMPLMISVDHRWIDGRTMCVFGNEVERLLQECPW